MFNFFKKKTKEIPPFNELGLSEHKNKYFLRISQWDWINPETIYVVDSNNSRMITLDPWPQLVYLDATGEKTISEFVYEMAGKYGRGEAIPKDLDLTLLETIDLLINEKLIKLADNPETLSYYIDLPIGKQDKEKAKIMMGRDNYIKSK